MPDHPPTLPDATVEQRLRQELPGWTLDRGRLLRSLKTDGWSTAVLLSNAIAFLGEIAWHHPDLEISWGSVRVGLTTHDAGGITERDLALAAEIERIAMWRPAAGSPLTGTSRRYVRDAGK